MAVYAEALYNQVLEWKVTDSEMLELGFGKMKGEHCSGGPVNLAKPAKAFVMET